MVEARLAFRRLIRTPGLLVSAVLTLALPAPALPAWQAASADAAGALRSN